MMVYYEIFARIDKRLFVELKKLKAKYNMKWSDLFLHLCSTNQQPTQMVTNYKQLFGTKKEYYFTVRINETAYRKFSIFAAVFKNNAQTLDYLLNSEIDKDDSEEGDFTSRFKMDIV